jgi:hypothetical protein
VTTAYMCDTSKAVLDLVDNDYRAKLAREALHTGLVKAQYHCEVRRKLNYETREFDLCGDCLIEVSEKLRGVLLDNTQHVRAVYFYRHEADD